MALSAEEKNFNERVANAPIVQSLREGQVQIQETLDEEIISNDKRFGNLEDKVESLEKKVDSGFNRLTEALDKLTTEIRSDKEKALLDSNKDLKEELTRKRNNGDKVKNGSLTGLVIAVGAFVLEKMEIINVVGQ